MKTECDKYPFDYNKHIIIKTLMTPQYRHFAEFEGTFQGMEVQRCTKCMVEGYAKLSHPFYFKDLSTEVVKCTLLRMGLKEVTNATVNIMPKMFFEEGDFLCESCEDELIQEELDLL